MDHDDTPTMTWFGCQLGLYLMGRNELSGALILSDSCTCGVDQSWFDKAARAVAEAEREDGGGIPSAFVVRPVEDRIECRRIGRIH